MKRRIGLVAAALALVAGVFGAGAAEPALATENHTIELSAPPTATPGQSILVRLNGHTATLEEWWDLTYIEVVAIPATVTPQCPADAHSAGSIAEYGGGRILAIAMRPAVDAAGNFTNGAGFTAATSGSVLLCAYLYNEVGQTYAYAWSTLSIGASAPAPTGSAAPVNVTPPRITRAGRKLVCHHGVWSNANGRYTYKWLFDGKPSPVTGNHAYITGNARGHEVSCQVTASGPGGSATAKSRSMRLR